MVEANKEDDLFREFEDSFARMESPMGRSDFTEEEKESVIKKPSANEHFSPGSFKIHMYPNLINL